MNDLWSYLFARVEFRALGGRGERLLGLCAGGSVPLREVRPCPGGFVAWAPARRYRRLARLARRCGVRLRAGRRRGAAFWLRRYRGRWGLALAPIAFFAAVHLLGQGVWAIRYDDLPATLCQELEQRLYSMDIYEGAVLTQESLRLAEKQLLAASDELSWVSLNFDGGRLVVEAAAAREKPAIEPNDPVDLVAAADGVLLEVNVQEGFALKGPGQTVAAGEVLVSACKPDPNDQPVASHTKGLVVAAVRRTYQCVQPSTSEAEALTGDIESFYRLRVMGFTFPLGPQPEEEEGLKTTHRPLTLLGFALPATLEERYRPLGETRQFHLSPDEARAWARYACMRQLYEEFPGAVLVAESRQESWEGGTLTYTMTVDLKADIARVRGG